MNDDHPEEGVRPPLVKAPDLLADLAMGLRFYSRLPVGGVPTHPPELNRMALALPFASVLIGLVPVLVLIVLTLLGFPGIFAAALAVALLLLVTGAMAEDGLADAADGLFGGVTATRRLEIMRDSRHGTYAVLALVLLLLLRVTALGAVAALHPVGAGAAWLGAMVLARSASLWLAVALPPARTDGLSAAVGGVTRRTFLVGIAIGLLITFVLAGPVAGVLGLVLICIISFLVVLGWAALCKRLVGGQTGDLIGALQALVEIATLTIVLGFA